MKRLEENYKIGNGRALTLQSAVGEGTRRKLFEFHHVAGERASLIGKEVLDLAQLFIEVGGLNSSWETL